MTMEQGEKIQDFWGVVEVMGHNTFAGMVSQSQFEFAGASFVRVDVPEVPARKGREYMAGPEGYKRYDVEISAIPGFTKLIGTASIYAMTPCSEELARKTAAAKAVRALEVVQDPEPKILALAAPTEEDSAAEEDDEEEGED